MDYSSILTDTKWNLIKELSEKEQTPTELAKKTNTSIANISQQLKLLEAYGLVKKERKINNHQPGKPKTLFSINKKVSEIMVISKKFSMKKNLKPDYFQEAILNANCLCEKKEDIYLLEKFIILNEEIVKKSKAIMIIKLNHNIIELLIITTTENLTQIREKYSNQELKDLDGEGKKIICWTHTITEIEEGIKSHNDHFTQIISELKPFLDKGTFFEKIKELKNGTN
ncbi:hypothetical protein CMO90_01835 [Candidatus Woesearchaeota archaeon]|jgi:DNA-binding transcriptional regulator GbsR (MarR family)|nr:hypothetical protein [Candidatus Woesearchaeota archaeon]|tara:strand:+ start:1929 stop:2609 length:681 start_codon:yes stop_codon:yes gene_type:complete